MTKICIGSFTSSAALLPLRRGNPVPFHRRRRPRSKAARAREQVSRLSGAWLMDQQESFGDTAR